MVALGDRAALVATGRTSFRYREDEDERAQDEGREAPG
jgi:hypothetical protein